MTWLGEHWLDIVGWGGSLVLIISLMQTRLLRFRIVNTVGCVLLVVYNSLMHVWPMVGVNVVLCLVNLWFIVRLLRERHDDSVYEVVHVRPDDDFLRHVLRVHEGDVLTFNPEFIHDPFDADQTAFLILKGDETVGVVLLSVTERKARILLDYVTPRHRDFSPGEFVWRRSDVLADLGIDRVVTPEGMRDPYYPRIGFRPDGDAWSLEVTR